MSGGGWWAAAPAVVARAAVAAAVAAVLAVGVGGGAACKGRRDDGAAPAGGAGSGSGAASGSGSGAASGAGSGAASGSGSGAASGSGTASGAASGSAASGAAAAALPSRTVVDVGLAPALRAGPVRSADGARVTWCTRGDDGVAEWVATTCYVVAVGRPPVAIPVMTVADALAIDEAADPAAHADAGEPAASARARVAAALARVREQTGEAVAMPAAVRCGFVDGVVTARDGRPATPTGPDDDVACVVGGVAAHVGADGKLVLTAADRILHAETFKPRARGAGAGGEACFLEASHVELAVDPASKLVAAAIWLSNPGDACAVVTEFEVRALRLP